MSSTRPVPERGLAQPGAKLRNISKTTKRIKEKIKQLWGTYLQTIYKHRVKKDNPKPNKWTYLAGTNRNKCTKSHTKKQNKWFFIW